jgi:transposase-like protein
MKPRFCEDQALAILREGEKRKRSILEICRSHGISEVTYTRWRRRFQQMGRSPQIRQSFLRWAVVAQTITAGLPHEGRKRLGPSSGRSLPDCLLPGNVG